MGYLLRMSAEIHDWLADLQRTDPLAAVLAGEALAALMSEGASLEAPLVTAVADPRPGDLRAALDLSYQVRLEQLQVARAGGPRAWPRWFTTARSSSPSWNPPSPG
jgi:hypothetical protein